MDDGLAEALFRAWTYNTEDETQRGRSFASLPTLEREAWQAVAGVARKHMRTQMATYLDAELRELEPDDVTREGMAHAVDLIRPR